MPSPERVTTTVDQNAVGDFCVDLCTLNTKPVREALADFDGSPAPHISDSDVCFRLVQAASESGFPMGKEFADPCGQAARIALMANDKTDADIIEIMEGVN